MTTIGEAPPNLAMTSEESPTGPDPLDHHALARLHALDDLEAFHRGRESAAKGDGRIGGDGVGNLEKIRSGGEKNILGVAAR